MEQITIIKRNGTKLNLFSKEPLCTVTSAVQNVTLMGDDNIQLSIKSTALLDFEKGDKIIVDGMEYSLRTKVTREIAGEDLYTYDAVFYGVMYELMKSQYRNTDANGRSTKSTFDLTYSLREFLKVIIYNVSRDYPGIWLFDEDGCPDTDPQTLQFSKQNCLQVLQTVCKQFNYDFRIDQNNGIRTIRAGRFGTNVIPPSGKTHFEWGKGNGLFKLKEQKVDDKSIITRLWVEGGTNNIRSEYREYSERLQLPYPKRLNQREHTLSDGTVIPAQSEYIGTDDDAKRYIEDPDLKDQIGSDEDTEYFDDIYPHRTGTVTALGSDIYSFVDDTMDFDLNEKDSEGTKYLISGVTAKLTFITGKLAGQQFELKEKGGYNHSTKTFSIIKYKDERGLEIPTADSEAFRIMVGDKYKITDINLPKSYEDNAEEDLWYAGYDSFMQRKQLRAQYVLTFDRSYFLNTLPSDSESSVFKCGDYVPVKDIRYNLEKNIRIQKMSRNLLLEHDYTLTLSDTTTISIQTQTILDVLDHNIIIDNNRLRDLNKARKGWRTTEELRNMVFDPDDYFDVDNIRPNSIDTNMLTVGSKSQQFVLTNTILQANVNGQPNVFEVSAGVLSHLTIEPEIRSWNMSSARVTLTEPDGYYVYARCSKAGNSGTYQITQEQIKVEPVSDPNNYYFQVGVIGSLNDDNFRDFVTTYGFTRINGNTITTGKITTSDGECYLDLDGNKFRIGDSTANITWTGKKLLLKGTMVQSPSGDESEIGVFRGSYRDTYNYYKGDEVTDNGSTHRCIKNAPAGITPTNTEYWEVVASKGDDGTSVASAPAWNTDDTPYAKNTMLSFAGKVFISNKETSEAPYPLNTDENGSRILYTQDGGKTYGYGIAEDEQSSDWDLILDPTAILKGVKETDVLYAASVSNSIPPITGWQTTAPDWEAGKFIWSKTKTIYTDNSLTESEPFCLPSGIDGVGIRSVIEEYYLSSSPQVLAGGSWSTVRPNWKNGWYYWTRSVIEYTDETSKTTTELCVSGGTGKNGDSVSLLGDWHTGLLTPYLGMVRMGSATWICKNKNGTYNPPLWVNTDENGDRILYTQDGGKTYGYGPNGERNTEEYELSAENGENGVGVESITDEYYLSSSSTSTVGGSWSNTIPTRRDGWYIWKRTIIQYTNGKTNTTDSICVTGSPGEDGKQGIQGCIIREAEWAIGVEWRNDESLLSGTRFLDVSLVRDNSTTTGWQAYKCLKTHISSTSNAPGNNTEYWEEFGLNVNAIFTSLIIAKNAKINFLQGNQLLIGKEDGTVTAGLSGSQSGGKIRLWAGGENPDTANFRVDESGNVTATSGVFYGYNLTPYKIYSGSGIDFPDLMDGMNIMLTYDIGNMSFTLPADNKYDGLEIEILYISGTFYAQINQPGSLRLYWRGEYITHIILFGEYSSVRLKAFKNPAGNLIWRIMNASDFNWINGGAGSTTSYAQSKVGNQ